MLLLSMPLLKDDEKKANRKNDKNLYSKILLTRLPVLLAQIKAGNNSCKLRNEIRQILCLSLNIIKSPKKL